MIEAATAGLGAWVMVVLKEAADWEVMATSDLS